MKNEDQAFRSPAMPCNPLPFINRMGEIIRENSTGATNTPQFRANLLIVLQITFGQIATVDLCDLWAEVNAKIETT